MAHTIVTLPTYNEVENIEPLTRKLRELGLDVLVADDNSPDGTWKLVEKMEATDSGVHLLLRKEKKGRGYAGAEAFAKAMEMGAKRIVEMDADFSHRPEDVPALLSALDNGALMAIGSRFVPGGKDTRQSKFRNLLTRFSGWYAATVLGVKIKDPNSGFRAYSAEVFKVILPEEIEAAGPGIVHEILYKAHLAGIKITEVPITFVDRVAGTSELTLVRLLAGFYNVIKLRQRIGIIRK